MQTNGSSDKLSALKAFRRANNLCFTCGEKWTGRNHKCPTQVPIHVIQELLDAVQVETEVDYSSEEEDSEPAVGQVVMSIQSPSADCSAVKSEKKNRGVLLTLRRCSFCWIQVMLEPSSVRSLQLKLLKNKSLVMQCTLLLLMEI